MGKLRKPSRGAITLGGFLIFVGAIIVAISTLAFFGAINLPVDPEQGKLFMWGLLVISLLNLTSGTLFVRMNAAQFSFPKPLLIEAMFAIGIMKIFSGLLLLAKE